MPANTRFGCLQRVFLNGESLLLNHIARLSVLYEDFRIERGALMAEEGALGEIDTLGQHYRTMYFIRRSLGTLLEFQGGLTQLVGSPEFKGARQRLPKEYCDYIDAANRYFQEHVGRLKGLRNEFGKHLKANAVKWATSNFSPDVVGKVAWNSSGADERLYLELHYSNELVAGVISCKLQGVSVYDELNNALATIFDSYIHVQTATNSLVHAFLWERFGR
jgi:hypothetical protein